jgi:hypothetical protein
MQTTNTATLTSNQVKAAFAAAGLNVRVRDLGRQFRVCTLDRSRMKSYDALITTVCAALGLTDVFGTVSPSAARKVTSYLLTSRG